MMQLQPSKALSIFCALAFLVLCVESMRLCGRDLPEALNEICPNGLNPMFKRSHVEDNEIDDNSGVLSILGDQLLLERMLGESAAQLMKTRRRRFGVSDECCLKACTFQELKSYCR
ncbi:probable insulin-like peptide 3 [Scaptodrosophila lebanonensis]|uniref:Probable insulin-like peptide 3 n=1 Tax=Drosophila lebanonensis TaxID=7225 RepID=A0A6J2T825_DROLE|nr:probable insulin-like peptide 3 [Scaptodrosophila lebanonensis]